MKNKILTLICFGLFLSGNIKAQSDKELAKDFGLSIIQSFFDKNCDYMFDNLDVNITSFEGGQTITITDQMRKLFCSESPLRPDIQVTYAMYEDNYAPQIYNMNELTQKHPEWQAHLNLQNGDFFFDGAHPIAAGNTRLFRAGDMARFALRKINGDWKIIAI